jgi:membrane-associated protease RseP (regulator of RpoE activity)
MDAELLWRMEEFRRAVDSVFPVTEVIYDGGLPAFAVLAGPDTKARFLTLRAKVEPLGYLPLLRRRNGREVIALVPRPPRGQWRWSVNLALFIATLATTFIAGYYNAAALIAEGYLRSAVGGGLAFSLSLMLILATHEMGHKVLSILRGVDSSLPYFIPMSPPFGTMGAVIVTRTPAPNRDALMDVAAAGPLAGFLVSIPILILGVARSFVISPTGFQGVNLPDPLILKWLIGVILHPPEGAVVLGHPILFAGWIGLLVTSLNLLPAGMLDGGHAVRALFGPRVHLVLSWIAVAAAALLGYVLMAVVILLLLRRGHPGPLDDISPVSPLRIAVGVALLAVFVLSAVPLRLTPF